MKICFVLQRRFAYLGNYLAEILQEKYGQKDYCGYVFLRSSYEFLKQQKKVNYSNLILDEDINKEYKTEELDMVYIQWLEKEFGTPYLWPFIAVDRIMMSNQLIREYPYNSPRYTHEDMLRIVQVTAKRLIKFLDEEKPDCIVFPVIGSIGNMLLYHIAKKRGILALHIVMTSLKNRYAISECYDSISWVDKHFKQKLLDGQKDRWYEAGKKYLEDFRKTPYPADETRAVDRQPMHRLKQLSFLSPTNFIRSLHWFGHLIYEHFFTSYRHDYSYISPWYYLLDRTKRKFRNLVGIKDLYDKFEPKEDFVFFPLHYEPEISLLLLAPYATDQIHLIKQIARSLPVTYKIYVKEHPLMVIFRPRSYYKELKKIPNVKLINPSIPGWKIIPHAKLITTITGSAGWESLLFKKPVIAFGDQFYNVLSAVERCRDHEQLPHLVKKQLEHPQYDEEELIHYIGCALEDTAEIPLSYIWEQETDESKKRQGLIPLADVLAKKMGLEPLL